MKDNNLLAIVMGRNYTSRLGMIRFKTPSMRWRVNASSM